MDSTSIVATLVALGFSESDARKKASKLGEQAARKAESREAKAAEQAAREQAQKAASEAVKGFAAEFLSAATDFASENGLTWSQDLESVTSWLTRSMLAPRAVRAGSGGGGAQGVTVDGIEYPGAACAARSLLPSDHPIVRRISEHGVGRASILRALRRAGRFVVS